MKNLCNLPNFARLYGIGWNKSIRREVITDAKRHERLRRCYHINLMKLWTVEGVFIKGNGIKIHWVGFNCVTHLWMWVMKNFLENAQVHPRRAADGVQTGSLSASDETPCSHSSLPNNQKSYMNQEKIDQMKANIIRLMDENQVLKNRLRPFANAAAKADEASEKQRQTIGSEISPDGSPGWGIKRWHVDAAREILGENSFIRRMSGNDIRCSPVEGLSS